MRGKGVMESMGDDSWQSVLAGDRTVPQKETLGQFGEVVISEVSQSNAVGYFGSLTSRSG